VSDDAVIQGVDVEELVGPDDLAGDGDVIGGGGGGV
jgi:hypothetical protein